MRNFIYAIGVCSLLFSCNSELETLPEEFNTEGTAPLVTRVAAHPKYGVLGWGYDVTGNYMSHGKGVTLPVIDIDRFEAENFDRIVLDSSTSQETEYYYGTTAEEYLKRVGDNVDTGVDAKKALFSLTITGNYQKNTSYSSEYSFAGCDHYYSLKRCYIRAAVERLQNYLSDTFREDLAELPAEDIVDFYGTHVLADIRMGGRVSFLYKTYAGKENVEAITKAGFKVNVLNLFSIGNEYQVNTSLAVNNSRQLATINVTGGTDAMLETFDPIKEQPRFGSVADWQRTVNADNAGLIDVELPRLIPIYELAADPTVKAALKEAVADYIESKRLKQLFPLYEYFRANKMDHYATSVWQGLANGLWEYQGVIGYVYLGPEPGTIPLYLYYNKECVNHYCTPVYQGEKKGDYVLEGITAYIYEKQEPGTVPLYMYYNGRRCDHYVTIVWQGNKKGDYVYEGNAGYVYP